MTDKQGCPTNYSFVDRSQVGILQKDESIKSVTPQGLSSSAGGVYQPTCLAKSDMMKYSMSNGCPPINADSYKSQNLCPPPDYATKGKLQQGYFTANETFPKDRLRLPNNGQNPGANVPYCLAALGNKNVPNCATY